MIRRACGAPVAAGFEHARPPLWSAAEPHAGADCYLRLYELRDAAVVSLQATVLEAVAMAAFLRGYERLLLLPAPELARIRVAELNGLSAVDPARNYVAAGGRVLRIPAVLDRLAAQGWTGLAVYDLAGGLPLAALAGRLVHSAHRAA